MENIESDMVNLRREIIRYLQKNPNAGDSLNGVMNWWIPSAYKKNNVAKIEQVLEQLITEGLVRKTSLVDGSILYRLGDQEILNDADS